MKPKIYPCEIDGAKIDKHALKVLKVLHEAKFSAYIVGGAVRDLLLGVIPKDFDIATDATPEQVKSLFRKAFIIGQRFKIVLVVFFGPEIKRIEVTTFRAHITAFESVESQDDMPSPEECIDDNGMILRDNVYGNIESDAQVRDFTINALYLDPFKKQVLDYTSGMADLKERKIRLIGDPATRFREDPVRILRSLRFMAKLGTHDFQLDENILEPMLSMTPLLKGIPEQRLMDETFKFFILGYALGSVQILTSLPLKLTDLPELIQLVLARKDSALFMEGLKHFDLMVAKKLELSPVYLLALCFWEDLMAFMQVELKEKVSAGLGLEIYHLAITHLLNLRLGGVPNHGKLARKLRDFLIIVWYCLRDQVKAKSYFFERKNYAQAWDFAQILKSIPDLRLQSIG